MKINTEPHEIVFIGNDIEVSVVFKNALSNLRQVSAAYFFDATAACDYISRQERRPKAIYMNAGKNKEQCFIEIGALRKSLTDCDCKLVMLDSNSTLTDTFGILSMGADDFIHKPYDYRNLRRALSRGLESSVRTQSQFSTLNLQF
ncbi:MAG: hypothetical protein EOO51_04855 [Flavobacterium sp.]|nr:MAG: hypothetical protein EOO51_04855 [Flavobacterium sp.]